MTDRQVCCCLLQEVPEGTKESPGGPWQFIGLMPLFDPPRHDSAETIRRALNLGVNVKMITGHFFAFCSEKNCFFFSFYRLMYYTVPLMGSM